MQTTVVKNQLPKHAIVVSDLTFTYPSSNVPVLHIPQWAIEPTERIFLYGESGSGKSTLLNLLAGVLKPSDGSITINGTNISMLSARQRDRFRANNIGVVFQQFNLIPYLTVLDNILLAAHFGIGATDTVIERAKLLLGSVNLDKVLLSRKAYQLSIGQQQRVAIVRALINSPPVLLVDEPTSALDKKNCDAFMTILFDILDQQNCALVFVSHDQDLAEGFSHRIDLNELNSIDGAG